jgi:hypothetical protein
MCFGMRVLRLLGMPAGPPTGIDDGISPYLDGDAARRDPRGDVMAGDGAIRGRDRARLRHWTTVIDQDAPRPRAVLNVKAALALLAGAVALIIPLVGLAAVALGVLAVREVQRDGGRGRGQAVAGIALGVVGLVLLVLALAGVIERPT